MPTAPFWSSFIGPRQRDEEGHGAFCSSGTAYCLASRLAPSLPRSQALDVGRETFHVLAWIEWPLAALTSAIALLGGAWIGRFRPAWKRIAVCSAAITAILPCETFRQRWLLDARVLCHQGRAKRGAEFAARGYIGLEAMKLALIIAAGGLAGTYPATAVSKGPVAPRLSTKRFRYACLVIRLQSDAHGPSLSAGFGPERWKTDLVSVISAMITPLGSRRRAAIPLTIMA
jgi:hypothetical protein